MLVREMYDKVVYTRGMMRDRDDFLATRRAEQCSREEEGEAARRSEEDDRLFSFLDFLHARVA